MPSTVYYGSPRQAHLKAGETLPAKLDIILERLNVRERVKNEMVVIKLHTGNNIGYSTIHPVFVRKVVKAVLDGGGHPFVVDVNWDVSGAQERGYSAEVLGCPVYPAAGPDEKYIYLHQRPFRNIQEWQVAGFVQDASFLINFAHAKGHPSCGYGGALKNLALGCMGGKTRSQMHDVMQYDPYWHADLCPEDGVRKQVIDSCPFGALVQDKTDPQGVHLHYEQCNQCGRCLRVAPAGSLEILPSNFHAFQEGCANSVDIVLSTFAPGKHTHLCLATHMTPVCDCFGFTSMPILPDAGIFGSDDIVALDQAVLDQCATTPLLEENVPTAMEVHTREGHPLRWLHGPLKDPYLAPEYAERLGVGTRQYELVDVLPVVKVERSSMDYIKAN